jgi:hypothetical protein
MCDYSGVDVACGLYIAKNVGNECKTQCDFPYSWPQPIQSCGQNLLLLSI